MIIIDRLLASTMIEEIAILAVALAVSAFVAHIWGN